MRWHLQECVTCPSGPKSNLVLWSYPGPSVRPGAPGPGLPAPVSQGLWSLLLSPSLCNPQSPQLLPLRPKMGPFPTEGH